MTRLTGKGANRAAWILLVFAIVSGAWAALVMTAMYMDPRGPDYIRQSDLIIGAAPAAIVSSITAITWFVVETDTGVIRKRLSLALMLSGLPLVLLLLEVAVAKT